MISEFVREQKRYTQNELCHILKCSEEHAIPLIRKLKEFGVLKAVKASDIQKNMADLLEEDIEMVDVEVGERLSILMEVRFMYQHSSLIQTGMR